MEDLEEIKETTKQLVEAFKNAKTHLDANLQKLKKEQSDFMSTWKNRYGKSTPILPTVAETFVDAACKLKEFLFFWEFLLFRFMGVNTLTYTPAFVQDSLQLHSLINRYLLSLHYFSRKKHRGHLFIAQDIDQVLAEVGVLKPAIRSLETTMNTEFPLQKSDEVTLLVDTDSLNDNKVTDLLDGEGGEDRQLQIDGEDPVDVNIYHKASGKAKRLIDAYYVEQLPSVIYNGMAVPAKNVDVAKTITEESEEEYTEETKKHFEELRQLRLLEAMKKCIRSRKRLLGKEAEDWRMEVRENEKEWLEPVSGLVKLPDIVTPDYYLLKAAEKIRQIIPDIQKDVAEKYLYFFRSRPEMAVSLPLLTDVALDIIDSVGGEDRLDIEPRSFIAKPKTFMNFMIMTAASYEARGYQHLLEINVLDVPKAKDRVVFLGDKNCDVCPTFYSREIIKKWVKTGTWKGVRADLYHNGRSVMGKVWCRRLYLVTSPPQPKWFRGIKREHQRIKTRHTPLMLWATRLYGNDSDDDFGNQTSVKEILNDLFKEKKEKIFQEPQRGRKGPRGYMQRGITPPPRTPQQSRPPTTPTPQTSPQTQQTTQQQIQRRTPGPPPPEFLLDDPEEENAPKKYAYKLSEKGIPQVSKDPNKTTIKKLLQKHYNLSRSQTTISRWIRELRDVQVS